MMALSNEPVTTCSGSRSEGHDACHHLFRYKGGAKRYARGTIRQKCSPSAPDGLQRRPGSQTHVVNSGISRAASGTRLAAIELLVPHGARASYGLLGGHFEPRSDGQLTVNIYASSPNERCFADSLVSRIDEVRVGLPEEYVEGVLDGIDLAKGELNTIAPQLMVNSSPKARA